MIVNLISNAFKFTDSGSISVNVCYEPQTTTEATTPLMGKEKGMYHYISPGVPLEAWMENRGGEKRNSYSGLSTSRIVCNDCNESCDAQSDEKIGYIGGLVDAGCSRSYKGGAYNGKGVGDATYLRSLPPTHNRGILVVSVSDTGLGMSPEQTGQLFEPFFQVRYAHKRRGCGPSIP